MRLQSVFGKRTRIVIDRFHVAKQYRKGFDTLRIKKLKRLKEELTKEEYAELKGAMWVYRYEKDQFDSRRQSVTKTIVWVLTFVRNGLSTNECSDKDF